MAGFHPTTRRPGRTILAVDASADHRAVLGRRLGERGHLVMLGASGREALDLIAGRGIDLLLIDMGAQDRSALDVVAELRGNRDTIDLPVIVMTGRSDPGAAVAALTAGADDWIARPFDFDVLAARIDRTLARSTRLIDLRRTNAALDARIARRAVELGETRGELAATRAERDRLLASLEALRIA